MVVPDNIKDSSLDTHKMKDLTSKDNLAEYTNGNEPQQANIQIREPSYVGVARCLSGYSTLSYDPSRQIIGRSPSPIRTNTAGAQNGNNNNFLSECGNYLSPVDIRNYHLNTDMPSENKGFNGITMSTNIQRANISTRETSVVYTSSESVTRTSTTSYSTPPRSPIINTTNGNNNGGIGASSFIVQRVERLYGPGALAQAFYSRMTPIKRQSIPPQPQNTPTDEADAHPSKDDGSKSVPVMRLLRPEFRAQLTMAPRRIFFETPIRKSSKKVEDPPGNDSVDACVSPVSTKAAATKPAVEPCKGHHFLLLLDTQVEEIEQLAESAERELENCPSEEACGVLRAFSGKARLLVAEKLNQFRGLCHKNIEQSKSEDFPTTNEDLAGFWDMVMIQVNDVLGQFENVKKMKENNWKVPEIEIKDEKKSNEKTNVRGVIKGSVSSKSQQQPTEASKARDAARRKMLQERRQAMKQAQPTVNTSTSASSLFIV